MQTIEQCDPSWRDRWSSAIRASERLLMQAICTFENAPGYSIFRSEEFPNFYAGNGLAIERPQPDRTLEDWVSSFRSAFSPQLTKHVTLVFKDEAFSDELGHEAERQGFHVYKEISMAAPPAQVASDRRPQSIRHLSMANPRDREALRQLHLAEAKAQDWYTDEAAFNALFAKTLALTERCGISWIAVPHDKPEKKDHLASALGYFGFDGLCRLQEVITAPDCRKRGHATTLLREVARLTSAQGMEAIGLLTEEEGDGASLYNSLGFRSVGSEVTLMFY